jgi:hypothetical protein
MEKKKVAILFYGLTRNLETTCHSIKENLLKPLNDNSIDYDIYMHTYKIVGEYKNEWSGESTSNYKNENIVKLLNPKYLILENQKKIVDSIDFNKYYKQLGNWTGMTKDMTKYLIRNMCLALYSKKRITEVFDYNIKDYDYAIIIRPDIQLQHKIDVNLFNELNENNIIIPAMDSFYGCNDRFCIGKPNVISYCGKLFDALKLYSESKSIISEVYFMDKLNQRYITILKRNIRYKQLRISK